MKLAVVCILATVACAAAMTPAMHSQINDHVFIEHINNKASTWKAAANPRFEGLSYSEIEHYFMQGDRLHETVPTWVYPEEALEDVPASFDGRTEWGDCLHPIRNQGHCGSCWAHSSSEAMSERTCLQTKGAENHVMSPQDQVSCDHGDHGCGGGSGMSSTSYLVHHGITTEECVPYVSGDGRVPSCPTTCTDGSAMPKFFAKNARHVGPNQKQIAKELMGGPGYIRFDVYQDFMNYSSGVYKHTTGRRLGGHAVKPVGWGTENGQDYWLIGNSWGTEWGDKGFFKIARGSNECGIEGGFVAFDYDHKA